MPAQCPYGEREGEKGTVNGKGEGERVGIGGQRSFWFLISVRPKQIGIP